MSRRFSPVSKTQPRGSSLSSFLWRSTLGLFNVCGTQRRAVLCSCHVHAGSPCSAGQHPALPCYGVQHNSLGVLRAVLGRGGGGIRLPGVVGSVWTKGWDSQVWSGMGGTWGCPGCATPRAQHPPPPPLALPPAPLSTVLPAAIAVALLWWLQYRCVQQSLQQCLPLPGHRSAPPNPHSMSSGSPSPLCPAVWAQRVPTSPSLEAITPSIHSA